MNRLLSSLLLLFLTVSTYPQISTSIEVTTKDGRAVILKPDGTWEFKKITPQPSPTPIVSSVKSSATTDSLPLNFSGQDAKTLYTQLLDLRKRLLKNEFETTAQYEKRVAEELQKPITDNLTVKDTFSIVVSGVRANYNADSQKMQFFLPIEKSQMAELLRSSSGLSRDKKTAYDLSYVNLYSIQWRSERGYETQGIFFDEMNNLVPTEQSYSQGFSAEVNLGVEDAKRLKNTGKAVVVVQFEEPYAGRGGLVDIQLQVRLVDIYFFDPQTGKILAKMSEVKK